MIQFLKRLFSKKQYKYKIGEPLFALNPDVDDPATFIITVPVKKIILKGDAAYVCTHRGRKITLHQKALVRPSFANGCRVKVKGSNTAHKVIGITLVKQSCGYQLIKITKKGRPFANGIMYNAIHTNVSCGLSNFYDAQLDQYRPNEPK